jgi:hypothetical protein
MYRGGGASDPRLSLCDSREKVCWCALHMMKPVHQNNHCFFPQERCSATTAQRGHFRHYQVAESHTPYDLSIPRFVSFLVYVMFSPLVLPALPKSHLSLCPDLQASSFLLPSPCAYNFIAFLANAAIKADTVHRQWSVTSPYQGLSFY